MQKYKLFGMKKPPEETEESEQKKLTVDNKTEPVIERLPLHQRSTTIIGTMAFGQLVRKYGQSF